MTATTVDRQRLYGLTVVSTFPLHQDHPVSAVSSPDVTITEAGTVAPTNTTPDGVVLLDFGDRPDRWYTAVRRSDGTYLLRVYSICDMEISADLAHVTLRMVEGTDPGMRSVMTTGTLLALQLYLREQVALHASAVEVDGSAIGFMGHSGMGKTTLATLMCADGARVVTDDVLPILPGPEPRVPLGASELRLRSGARDLVAEFQPGRARHRISADRRHVLAVEAGTADELPLAALVIPRPNRQGHLAMEALSAKSALFAILSFPRLMGWLDPTVQSRIFTQASALAASVPVIVAHVPWGPPFRADVTERIREAVSRYRRPVLETI